MRDLEMLVTPPTAGLVEDIRGDGGLGVANGLDAPLTVQVGCIEMTGPPKLIVKKHTHVCGTAIQ